MSVRTSKSLRRLHDLARSRTDQKGVLRQWVEMLALFVLYGNGPNFYQMAGFWREGQPWSEMTRHLSYRRFKAHIDALNPPAYQKLSQNKVVEKAILMSMGIPTPRFVGVLDPKWGRDVSGAPLRDADDLARSMAACDLSRVCFKLVEGYGGKGFEAVEIVRGPAELRFRPLRPFESDGVDAAGQRPADSRTYSAVDLIGRLGDAPRVIEEYIEQHTAFARFNGSSVNTMRVWVLRRAGKTSTRLAYLKIGRQGSLVDNRGAGGIVARIDLRTGRLSEAIDGVATRNRFTVHPDSGAQIEGVLLPGFADAIALAERCLTVFPGLNFAGIDVAMAQSGPTIIEMNVQPGRNGAVFGGMPTKDVFAP